jgi:hypothetical protein
MACNTDYTVVDGDDTSGTVAGASGRSDGGCTSGGIVDKLVQNKRVLLGAGLVIPLLVYLRNTIGDTVWKSYNINYNINYNVVKITMKETSVLLKTVKGV